MERVLGRVVRVFGLVVLVLELGLVVRVFGRVVRVLGRVVLVDRVPLSTPVREERLLLFTVLLELRRVASDLE